MKRDNELLEAVGEFLRANEWSPLVVGGIRIQQQPGESKYNFELVVRFTGRTPETPTNNKPTPSAKDNDVK